MRHRRPAVMLQPVTESTLQITTYQLRTVSAPVLRAALEEALALSAAAAALAACRLATTSGSSA